MSLVTACVQTGVHLPLCEEVGRQLSALDQHFLSCECQEGNAGPQAWPQVPLRLGPPARPSFPSDTLYTAHDSPVNLIHVSIKNKIIFVCPQSVIVSLFLSLRHRCSCADPQGGI